LGPPSADHLMISFARIPVEIWQLRSLDDCDRRRRLIQSAPYPQLVRRLAARSEVLRAVLVAAKSEPRALRLEATLLVHADDLDLFFNSCTGYRAQYYEAEALGDAANRIAIEAILSSLISRALYPRTRKPAGEVARASLEAPAAKLWIHQGSWLRRCRLAERVLIVPRWQAGLSSEQPRTRKLARWGSLAPAAETRVVVKGAFILDGRPIELGKAPEARAGQLHTLGFT